MTGSQTNHALDHGQPHGAEHSAILEQVEAYALGALDRVDTGIVEQHLRWCPPCRHQADMARQVVELLPLAVPVVDPPPPLVKTNLLSRIAADHQENPYERAPDLLPDAVDRQRNADLRPRPTIAGSGPTERSPVNRTWLRFVPPAIIAPLVLALLLVGAWANSMRLELADQERADTLSNQAELNRIVANGGDVELYSMEPQCDGCSGRGRLGVDTRDNMGVVVAWGLNPDQEHEVWCVNSQGDKQMISALDVDADGGAMQAFAFPSNDVREYTEVYVAQKDGGATYMVDLAPEDVASPTATLAR